MQHDSVNPLQEDVIIMKKLEGGKVYRMIRQRVFWLFCGKEVVKRALIKNALSLGLSSF